MPRIRERLFDRLGDPAGWPGAPVDFRPPSKSYLLARLASVSHSYDELVIVVETEGKLFQSTFGLETVSRDGDIQPENVVAMIQQKVGGLLLDALDIKMPESGSSR